MPIYEFICSKCQKRFDKLCRIQWEGTVRCPSCGSEELTKALSGFASPGSGGGSGCGGCSSHNCGSCK